MMKPMMACGTRPRIFQYIENHQVEVKDGPWKKNAPLCTWGRSSRLRRRRRQSRAYRTNCREVSVWQYSTGMISRSLITVAQPNATPREVLPPVMLQQD